MRQGFKKTAAVFTLITFFCQPSYALSLDAGLASNQETRGGLPLSIELPAELGRVERLYSGTGPLLIHIQEAHGDPVIQKRIDQILTHLKTKYGIQQIFIEGSAFSCDRSLLDFFPDQPKTTQAAAASLMNLGAVSGPEMFYLKNPGVSLSGVEDLETYNNNSRSFYRVLRQKKKTARFLRTMEDQMDRLAGAYLNSELRNLLRNVKAFDEERLSLQGLLALLEPQMKKYLRVDLRKTENQLEWPMLVRLSALERWQKQFDQTAFEQEKKVFLNALRRFQSPVLNPGLARLESFLMETGQGLPSAETSEIEAALETVIKNVPVDFDYTRYPQVLRRFAAALVQKEIDGELLMNEVERAIRQLEDDFAPEAGEKEMVALLRDYRLAVKLLKLEWTRRDFESVRRQAEGEEAADSFLQNKTQAAVLSPSSLAERALRLNRQGRVKDVRFERVQDLEKLYREALVFYQGAEERETSMLESIQTQMKASGDPRGVLVTGGFHASALARRLKEKNWNYALLTPQLFSVSKRDSYVESLLQNYSPDAEARAGLKDIPYATTPLESQLRMDRSPAVFIAQAAAVMERRGASAEVINQTALVKQLNGGLQIRKIPGRTQVRLDPDESGPVFEFDSAGKLRQKTDSRNQKGWLQKYRSSQARSEVRFPGGEDPREETVRLLSGRLIPKHIDALSGFFISAEELRQESMVTLRINKSGTFMMTDDEFAQMDYDDLMQSVDDRQLHDYYLRLYGKDHLAIDFEPIEDEEISSDEPQAVRWVMSGDLEDHQQSHELTVFDLSLARSNRDRIWEIQEVLQDHREASPGQQAVLESQHDIDALEAELSRLRGDLFVVFLDRERVAQSGASEKGFTVKRINEEEEVQFEILVDREPRRSEMRAEEPDFFPRLTSEAQIEPYLREQLDLYNMGAVEKMEVLSNILLIKMKFGLKQTMKSVRSLMRERPERLPDQTPVDQAILKSRYGLLHDAEGELLKRPDPLPNTLQKWREGYLHASGAVSGAWQAIQEGQENARAWIQTQEEYFKVHRLDWPLFMYLLFQEQAPPEWLGPFLNQWKPDVFSSPDLMSLGKERYVEAYLEYFSNRMQNLDGAGAGRHSVLLKLLAGEWVGILHEAGWFLLEHPAAAAVTEILGPAWASQFEKRFASWLDRLQENPQGWLELTHPLRQEWFGFAWEYTFMPPSVRERLPADLREAVPSFLEEERLEDHIRWVIDTEIIPPSDEDDAEKARSEVRSHPDDPLDEFLKELSGTALAGLKKNLRVLNLTDISRAVPMATWMGRGEALYSWGHPSLRLEKIPQENLERTLDYIRKKVAAAEPGVKPQAELILAHLEKTGPHWFDEQRYAISAEEQSYLIGHTDAGQIAIGRGFFDSDVEFAAAGLFRAAEESFRALEQGALRKRNAPDIAGQVLGDQRSFSEKLKTFVDLSERHFLLSAVSRFKHFEPDSPYFRTMDLLKDWIQFHAGAEQEDPYPVTEQAGFLVKKLWPLLNDAQEREADGLAEAYFKVVLPLYAFAIYRQQIFRSLGDIVASLEDEIKGQIPSFYEAVRFYSQVVRDAPPGRTVSFPPYPDKTVDEEVLEAALEFVVQLAKSPLGHFETMANKPISERTAKIFLEGFLQKNLQNGNRKFQHVPAYALKASVPEVLTPEAAEKFLEEAQAVSSLALGHLKWLKTAVETYASESMIQRNQVFVEGYIVGENALGYRDFDPIQLWYAYVSSERRMAFTDNNSPKGYWLGITDILEEQDIPLTTLAEGPALKLLTGGGAPIAMRGAPSQMVYYNSADNGQLSILVHKNSVISDLLAWLHSRWKPEERELLKPWEQPVAGLWPALVRIRLGLSVNSKLPETYFSPLKGDLSAWADSILQRRKIAESSYWRSVARFGGVDKVLSGADELAAGLELYALFRNSDGLLATLADSLAYKPGSKSLTDEAMRAVLDTLAALWWSGAPREHRANTTFFLVLEEFRKRMKFHPDGISVENLDEFKDFLMSEVSPKPLESRMANDFALWSKSTRLKAFLTKKFLFKEDHQPDFSANYFLPPEVDSKTGMAARAQIRAENLPSYFDPETFPAEDFLKPERWPLWKNYRGALVVEWTGRYAEEGLSIPGSDFVYRFNPGSGVEVGDLIRVFWTLEPGVERTKARLKMVKLPALPDAASAKSEVRAPAHVEKEEVLSAEALRWGSYDEMLERLQRGVLEMGRQVSATADPVKVGQLLLGIRLKILAAEELITDQQESLMYTKAARSVLEHLENLFEQGRFLSTPEIRRVSAYGGYDYELAAPEADTLVVSRQLLEAADTPLAQLLLFFAAVVSREKSEEGWSEESRATAMEMLRFMFPEISELKTRFNTYVSRGLILADLDYALAAGRFGGAGEQWQKVPRRETLTLQQVPSVAGKTTVLPGTGWMELPGGQNGLFVFDLPAMKPGTAAERIAVNLSELHGQPLLLHVDPSLQRLDFYTHDARHFIGTLEKKEGRWKSGTSRVALLPARSPLTSQMMPQTTVEYMALYGLGQGLASLVTTGRTYSRIDYLHRDLLEASNQRVQLDLERGHIYLDPELVFEAETAYQLVRQALEEHDPLYLVRARTKAILEVDVFNEETLPPVLAPVDESLLSLWPDRGEKYRRSYEEMLRVHRQRTLMRKIDLYREKNSHKFQKNGVSREKFRAWLKLAADYIDVPDPEEFFFATKQKGGETKTLMGSMGQGPKALQWQEPGVGVAIPAYFSGDYHGQFTLGYNRNNTDPRRYLFIRYPDPDGSGRAMLDIFDLENGELIQNQEIEFRKSQVEYQESLQKLMQNAQGAQTRLNTDKLNEMLENFLNDVRFSEAEEEAYRQAKPQEFSSLYLLRLKIKLLGHLDHILYSVLDSSEYPEAQNFAVAEMVLASLAAGPVMGELFGDDTQGAEKTGIVARAKRISDAFSVHSASKRLISELHIYLSLDEDWTEFQQPEISAEEQEQLTEDLTQRVLVPFVRASEVGDAEEHNPRMDQPSFLTDLFDNIFKAIRAQIRDQAEAYFEALAADKKREGYFALHENFLKKNYQPVAFPHREQMLIQEGLPAAGVTAVERYFIEKIFRQIDSERFEKIPEAEKMTATPIETTVFGGSAEGIGASSTLFKYGGTSILVDSGIMIDDQNTPPLWPAFDTAPDIAVVTHDHLDHVGSARRFWSGPAKKKINFYSTQGSRELMPSVLGAMRQTEEGRAYNAEEIAEFMKSVYALQTGTWYQVTPEMKIYLHGPVGHLHGAASLLISTPDSTGFVMGDISYRPQGPVPGWVNIPEEYRTHIDWAVIEATNGMIEAKSEDAEEKALLEAVTGRLKLGGKVLLPAFANGRAQRELALLVQRYALNPQYENLKIYMDGQAAWFTLLYLEAYPEFFRPYQEWLKKNLVIIPDPRWNETELAKLSRAKEFAVIPAIRSRDDIYAYREDILQRQKQQPTIVIASSGNATQGMSHWWAKHLAVDAENGIYFAGYMDEDEAGGRLLLLARDRNETPGVLREFAFNDRVVYVHADIQKFGLSGHIRGVEIMRILKTFGPSLKEVTIQHGGPAQRRAIFQWIKKRHPSWGPRLIRSGRNYKSALPRTAEALRDRRHFFENLAAAPLPGRKVGRTPASPVEAVVSPAKPKEPLEKMAGPEIAAAVPEPPTPASVGSAAVSTDNQAAEVSVPDQENAGAADAAQAPAFVSETPASIKPVNKEAESAEIPVPKKRKPSTTPLYNQIQTSGSLYNAIGKLRDADLILLAELVDNLSSEDEILVIKKTRSHPEWQGKVTTAVREKLKRVFLERGLSRSEIRSGPETSVSFQAAQNADRWEWLVRRTFAEGLLPVGWPREDVLAALRFSAEKQALAFQTALARYPQLLETARNVSNGDLPRKIIDQRGGLPSAEDTLPILALLASRPTLSYVIVSGADSQEVARFRERLEHHLGLPEVRQKWGRISLEKLSERFQVVESRDETGQGAESGIKTAVMAQVLSGQRDGARSAVVTETPLVNGIFSGEARRYRFLNLYTPKGVHPTALVWLSAELLDELTDDLLAAFDNQALALDARWQGLADEMRQLLAVRQSA